MCFHFPLMREMQPSPRGRRNSQGAAFISRLCARCNLDRQHRMDVRVLSFPAYARDATAKARCCHSSRRTTKTRRAPFISRLRARCNVKPPGKPTLVPLSFPAYARDATWRNQTTLKSIPFHFPLMREMQPAYARFPFFGWWTFISRLCARCNSSQKRR